MSLADKQCVPCRGGVPPLEPAKVQELLGQLDQGWALNADGHIERLYEFKDFAEALAFVNAVGAIAETKATIPTCIWRGAAARVEIWTHKIHGLTESDFYLAAKADRVFAGNG